MRVSELFIYPLKSGRGIALPSSPVDAFGLDGDRRLMVTDANGKFITQRDMQDLARLQVLPEGDGYRLAMNGHADLHVQRPAPDRRLDVVVWDSPVNAALAADEVNTGLSAMFGRDVQLVFFDDVADRRANDEWTQSDTPVTFADGYQILVTTTGSLDALNRDLAEHGEETIGMDRFRPNIVIDCDEPWADDRWAAIEIAGIRLDFVKPCARCIMTTQDQMTGSREGANPMPAMGRLRMSADRRVPGPLFGWNAVPRGMGTLSVGDTATVLETRDEGWAIKVRRTAV